MGYRYNIQPEQCNFYVNKEKRTVVCVINVGRHLPMCFIEEFCYKEPDFFEQKLMPNCIPTRFVGKAICSESDEWDEELGKEIAFTRAKRKYMTSLFKSLQGWINKCDELLLNSLNTINTFGQKVAADLDYHDGLIQKKLNK